MTNEDINYKDLTKEQLNKLKDIYIESRINAMSESDLRKFAKEIFDLQIRGTVGNEEEREVWKEMKEHFEDNFETKIKDAIKVNGIKEVNISPEQLDFAERLDILEKRKKAESQQRKDMWDED